MSDPGLRTSKEKVSAAVLDSFIDEYQPGCEMHRMLVELRDLRRELADTREAYLNQSARLVRAEQPSHEPCRDAEAILEAYDAVWIEDERLADLKRAPPPQALKACRERFNAARAAVLAAMRPSPPPPADLLEEAGSLVRQIGRELDMGPGLKRETWERIDAFIRATATKISEQP
jgi:Fe-S-cluster formation regulator IscX/YfhJ